MNLNSIQTFSFVNEDYKKEWTEFVPFTNNKYRYKDGTCGSEVDFDKWCVYDGATNSLAWIDKKTHEVEYNGTPDDYKQSFVKYALKALEKMK